MIEHVSNMFNKITSAENKERTIRIASITLVVIISAFIIYYIINKLELNDKNCQNINSLYPKFPHLSSINSVDPEYQHKLRDYYVKTAYNSCCSGQFKNDYVNTCALKSCIRQGARCLDFEIYSVNNRPVIATSSVNKYDVKQMYNYVPLEEAIQIVNSYAFSGSTCPNANDPLILHFRIMSKNENIYKMIADTIYNHLSNRLLDKTYSYQYDGMNLGAVPLTTFMGKIIIAADKSNPLFESTPLAEYVNITSNSIFMRASRNYDIVYAPDMKELIEYNKKQMTLSMPDLSPTNTNVSSSLHMKYGCQFVGMCFQNGDANMQYYNGFFDEAGHAYVLKPENLRFIPVTIPDATPQKPENSYASRNISSDFYNFKM